MRKDAHPDVPEAGVQGRPEIRALTQHECLELLARNHVGRLAFTFHDRVDIQPIHYVYDPGWLYGRTSEGAKLTTLAHHHWIAFEVDEVRGVFDWGSVVVRGTFHRLDEEGSATELAERNHAMRLARLVVPETFTPEDPVPHRTVVFGIAIGEMTGRRARPPAVGGN
jgi:uncharacterized protein